MKSSNIGGQAVMEGIMMRHKDKYAIAVRRPDKEIELKVEDYKCTFGKAAFLKWPIIRGVVTLEEGMKNENAKLNLADTAEQVIRLMK